MLLKEIFQKMYDSNAARIKKLQYFMKENKKRLDASEARIERCGLISSERISMDFWSQL
jgi:division protein CdvB (Snf7/Vps24/ESCRT-III family)